MKTVRVLQLGREDFSGRMQVADCAEWHYEPDFSKLPEKDFDVAILDRGLSAEEEAYLERFLRAHCLFVTDAVDLEKEDAARELFVRKVGKILSAEKMAAFVKQDLPYFFPGSYGEKYQPQDLALAQGYQGEVSWIGYEGVALNGEYGETFRQLLFWRGNIPIEAGQTLEFWLEYEKEETLELALELRILRFGYGTEPDMQDVRVFSGEELNRMIYVENQAENRGYLFASLSAKGMGRLTLTALHDRYSRKGNGCFLPGGRRIVTSKREEIFSYFDPGNLKPPLNVYFSGYKTKEGFEGYNMMRKLEHPFLLIAEARLEGGGFYLGEAEYEDAIERVIRKYIKALGFQNSDVILSGLSMGSVGALYYGARIHPDTILVGKPLPSVGDVAANERINRPGGFPTSLDVLHKLCGSLGQDAVQRMNRRFWDVFDRTDWSGTKFAVAYMIEDDYDQTAYEKLQSHLMNADAQIYGKGLHGRHNDNTAGIVNWFVNQYQEIIWKDFDGTWEESDGSDER